MFGVVPLACNEIETEIYALDIVRDPNDYYVRSFSFGRREQKSEKCLRSIYSIHVSGSRSLLMFNFGCKPSKIMQ